MSDQLTFKAERIGDIPLLLTPLERMQVGLLLDEHFPTHGNWQGLSLGTVSAVWLAFILSEGDHRLSHVQPWVEARLPGLGAVWASRCGRWIGAMTAWRQCWII